jgi:sugar/nucleoside kinase (ribokinase family)
VTPVRKWDVVGVGENSVDTILTLAESSRGSGRKARIAARERALGGQVVTTLCTCASLGLRAAYVGTFGNDVDGAFARDELRDRGVDVEVAIVRPCANRHAVILVEPGGDRVVLWSRDPRLVLKPSHLPADLLASARLVHVDAVDLAAALEAARLARAAGAFVTCDVDAVDDDTVTLVEAASHPVLAEHVPAALTGEGDVERAIHLIGRRHAGPICVTLGARGALLLENGRLHRVAGWPIDAVDTTGAGDVFRGAFIAALLEGQAPLDILRFANAAAAVSCTRAGAVGGVPSRAEVDALLLQEQAPQRGNGQR